VFNFTVWYFLLYLVAFLSTDLNYIILIFTVVPCILILLESFIYPNDAQLDSSKTVRIYSAQCTIHTHK